MRKKNKRTTEYDKSTITCNIGTAQCENNTIKCEKKGTIKCDKSTVTCNVGTTQCEDDTIKCEKKNKRTTKCGKIQSHVMLVLYNVRMVISLNVRKKK